MDNNENQADFTWLCLYTENIIIVSNTVNVDLMMHSHSTHRISAPFFGVNSLPYFGFWQHDRLVWVVSLSQAINSFLRGFGGKITSEIFRHFEIRLSNVWIFHDIRNAPLLLQLLYYDLRYEILQFQTLKKIPNMPHILGRNFLFFCWSSRCVNHIRIWCSFCCCVNDISIICRMCLPSISPGKGLGWDE